MLQNEAFERNKRATEEETRKLAKKKISESMRTKAGATDRPKPSFILDKGIKSLPGTSASLSELIAKDTLLKKVFARRSDVSSTGSREISMGGPSTRADNALSKPGVPASVTSDGTTEHQVVMPSLALRKRLKELNSKRKYTGGYRDEERSEFEEGSSTGQKRKRS